VTRPRAAPALLTALVLGAVLSPAPAVAQAPVRPQVQLKCDFSKANRPAASQALIAPLSQGAFTPIPLETVQLIDKTLSRKIVAQGVEARRTETDTVEVVARLVNCGKDPLQLQLRTSFLSAGRSPTEPTSSWQRIYVAPKSTGIYTEKSISRDVAHYLIEVRRGD
jgi:hypothetical protein